MVAIPVPPIGFAYVVAAARAAGHEAVVLDAIGEAPDKLTPLDEKRFACRGLTIDEILERVPTDADAYALSVMFSQDWAYVRRLTLALKEKFPHVPIVAGGEAMTALPEYSIETGALDHVVLGEGEEGMADLLDARATGRSTATVPGLVTRVDGQIQRTAPRERIRQIDRVARPAWDLFPLENYLSRGLSFARVAQRAIDLGGTYDGHELPEDINGMTTASATALAGQGLMGVAKDNYEEGGRRMSFTAGFAEVEVDIETGAIRMVDYVGSADCGTVVHPRLLGSQIHSAGIQGFGIALSQKWVFDPVWGVTFAKRLYTARPPGILDVPLDMQWEAVGLADPGTPVGAKGIGEPCVGAGSAALTSAIADAMEGVCLCRTPLTPDVLLAEIEGREPAYDPLDLHV